MIRGIIFDLDGTLIHSVIDFWDMKQRMIEVLEANGIPKGTLTPEYTTVKILTISEEIWDLNGVSNEKQMKIKESLDVIMNQAELEAISKIQEIEGAAHALKTLKEKGLKLAVLTRSHHEYAVEALKKIEAYNYFDVILGRGETPKPKPHAEALQHASELLGLRLDEIVFVGDHHIDANCAKNANTQFIGVRTGIRGDDSWAGKKPQNLLNSVEDLPGYFERFENTAF